MPLPKATPGKGEGRPRVSWSHVQTSAGPKGQWHAYVAGPCYWCRAHTKHKSQPCLEWMTGGALLCPRCNPLDPIEVIGYQPLYRAVDSRPVFVIVHEYIHEQIDALPFHRRVLVGRNEGSAEAIWITPALDPNPKFQTTLADRKRPADLTESLLCVWRYPQLKEWYARYGSDKPLSLPEGTAVTSDGKPFSPIMQAAAKRAGCDVITPEIGTGDPDSEVEREFLRAVQEGRETSANGNGKHKRPKKG